MMQQPALNMIQTVIEKPVCCVGVSMAGPLQFVGLVQAGPSPSAKLHHTLSHSLKRWYMSSNVPDVQQAPTAPTTPSTPVIILTMIPASCATLTASMASSLGGSKMAMSATRARAGLRLSRAVGFKPVEDSSGNSSPLNCSQHVCVV